MTLATPARLRIGCVQRLMFFPYWATIAQGMNDRAAELGIELCLPSEDADQEWDGPVHEVLRQQPSVVILPRSVTNAFPETLRPFAAAGIPVVGVETEPSQQYASVVCADEGQGASTVVTYLFDRMGGQGKVANIFAGGGLTKRHQEFHTLAQQQRGIVLAYEDEGNWDRPSGAKVMRAALDAHPDLRGVFAHNDHMALGASDIIAEQGLSEQIIVVGFDADPEGLIAIREGRMAATVYRGLYGIGRTAVDTAVRAAQGERLPPEIRTPTTLITAENLVDATLDTTSMLPGLLRDLVTSNQTQRQLQRETIEAQQRIIRELSTPIIPISDSILIMPLIGTIDGARAQQILEAMLEAIGQYAAQYMVIDITGIAMVDTSIAHHLMQSARAIQLLGAQAILVGISPEVAQTLVGLGVDFSALVTRATLQDGFEYARKQLARSQERGGSGAPIKL